MNKRTKWKMLFFVLLIALAIWKIYPIQESINLGLDLKGGMYLVYEVQLSELPQESQKDAVDRAVEIIRNRIDQFGVLEPMINKQGKDRIVLQLPGVTDRKRALSLIGQTALLEFKIVDDTPETIQAAREGNVPAGFELKELGQTQILVATTPLMTGETLANASLDFDSARFGEPFVSIEFDSDGGKQFANITRSNVGKRLAIVLDGKVHSAPQIREAIPGGRAQITGSFSRSDASDLALVLRAGALPAPLELIEERTIGASLGKDFVSNGVKAALFGGIAVILFMAVYYFLSGLIADFALCLNLLLLFACLSLLKASLTLPGIAGIALTLGMAVDANVLIFERIREELNIGKQLRSAIAAGYNRAFLTILDANVTTLIAAVILFWFGTGPVRGFATTLSIGVVISMFTSIVVTRTFFDWITRDKSVEKLHMLRIIKQPHINFVNKRKIAYMLSLIIIVIGLTFLVTRGQQNLGIEFTGGVELQYSFEKPIPVDELRDSLSTIGLGTTPIQQFGQDKEFIIRTSKDATDQIKDQFAKSFSGRSYNLVRVENIGPAIGKELTQKALWAVLLAFLGMCIYIAIRFEFKFAIAAITALLHDIAIVLGAIAIARIEISLPVVAAILAMLGYSINDTIVVFDRIREDMKLMKKATLSEIVNASINQTMSRTILTSLTTLLVILSLFFFGGKGIHDFSFVFLIGILTGTYSSIFVASPIIIDWPKKV